MLIRLKEGIIFDGRNWDSARYAANRGSIKKEFSFSFKKRSDHCTREAKKLKVCWCASNLCYVTLYAVVGLCRVLM